MHLHAAHTPICLTLNHPRFPSPLCVPSTQNEPLEVENSSPLPPMVLCVYDLNHNITAPSRGEQWAVKVCHLPC